MPNRSAIAKVNAEIRNRLKKMDDIQDAGVREFLAKLDELRRQVVMAVANEQQITPYTASAIKAQIAELTQRFKFGLESTLTEYQRKQFVKGIQLIDAVLKTADLTVAVPYLSEQLLEQAKNFGAELVTGITDDARKRIATEIDLAVMGQKPMVDVLKSLGKNLEDPSVFGTIAKRAETIYKTEVNRMGNLATIERMKQAKGQVIDLKKTWLHSHQGVPRPGHLRLDGITIDVGEKFVLIGKDQTYFPMSPHDPILPASESVNCFEGETLVDAREIEVVYRSVYSGEIITVITSRGHKVTGTPNHPILTPSGFVPMKFLHKGSSIMCSNLGNGLTPWDPDIKYMPTTIEQVFDAASKEHIVERVLGSIMNFYGDGSDSDVDIVRTESQLRNGRQKAQTRYEADFLGGLLGKCFLLGDGFLVEFAIRRLSPAPCNMRKMRELATFFLTQSAHSQDHRFTAGPNVDASIAEIIGDGHTIDAQPFGYGKYRFPFFIHPDYQRDIDFNFVPTKNDTAFLESPPNNLVIDSERSSNFVGALSSSVSPDNIIQLFRREVNSLHVYTFQTASGIYNAGGIVASNCRCHVIPYVERFS